MDPARWEQIETLCEAALERDGSSRGAFLAEACGSDGALLREVESLLEQVDQHPEFLERPIIDLTPMLARNDDPPATGSIGAYRLVRELGRGGMGVVYLAVRDVEDIRQHVALKVIRRGMDTDEVLERFRLERRILANLNHPNIARLLDAAATDDGRPYFVMEHVDGVALTDFCDREKLSIPARLRLFQSVCGAVQHAHQHLIIHRDLKPSNILVTADGVPKLLDFGIGKVLGPAEALGASPRTSSEVRLLTPEYAAPEQVSGDPVTTSTDVYALGVMLYEILSGHHPYRAADATRQEVERAVLEVTPSRPSAMVSHIESRRLSGDLDMIVLHALRKEPSRRYPSAAALSDDLQRHLDGLPVAARPDTLGYRSRKFVRRHAGGVAAAVMTFLALGVTTAVTLVQSRRVAHESERVALERDKALEVRGFLMEMFGATGADQAVGDTITVRRLLDLQAAQLKTAYADRPDLRADMMDALADGYDRLNLFRDAEPLAREALEIRRRILTPQHPDVAASLNLLGWIEHQLGRSREAEPMLRDAIAFRREAGPRYRADLSRSLNDLGVVYNALARYPEAETVSREALEIRRAQYGDAHRVVGITANNLAAAYYFQGKLDSAVAYQTLAVDALQQSVGADHQRTVIALGNLAAFKSRLGQLDAAERDYRELLVRQTRIQGSTHTVTARVMASLASVVAQRARTEGNDALHAESERLFRESLTILETNLGPTHPQVGQTLHRLSEVLAARNRSLEAIPIERRALSIFRLAYGDSNSTTMAAHAGLASLHARSRQLDDAIRIQREVVDDLVRARGASHALTGAAQATLCEFLLARGRDPAAARLTCATAEHTLGAARGTTTRSLALVRLRLAQSYLLTGNARAADSILSTVRVALDTNSAAKSERRLLDSLTVVLRRRLP